MSITELFLQQRLNYHNRFVQLLQKCMWRLWGLLFLLFIRVALILWCFISIGFYLFVLILIQLLFVHEWLNNFIRILRSELKSTLCIAPFQYQHHLLIIHLPTMNWFDTANRIHFNQSTVPIQISLLQKYDIQSINNEKGILHLLLYYNINRVKLHWFLSVEILVQAVSSCICSIKIDRFEFYHLIIKG